MTPLWLGLDLGTSGVRAAAIDAAGSVQATAQVPMAPPRRDGARVRQDPDLWWAGVEAVLDALRARIDLGRVVALAVDGSSGSWLFTDAGGVPLGEASMYDDSSAAAWLPRIAAAVPPQAEAGAAGAALGPSSPLARLLQALPSAPPGTRHLQHQAEWIAGRLAGRAGLGDEHNGLKLGYDPVARAWPAWLDTLGVPRAWLPQALAPGTPLGPVDAAVARRFGLAPSAQVVAGTTDGVAAFLASGAEAPGDGVTSLGSTLVLKMLAARPIAEPALGVYSHRLGARWLVGGASNSGGAALRRHFEPAQMAALEARLSPETPTGLDYWPLAGVGERFPVADVEQLSRTTPRPDDDARFFQGLLEGIAAIEAEGYRRLAGLGAPPLQRVWSSGRGAANAAWTRLRERALGVSVLRAVAEAPAAGAARLALRGVAIGDRRADGET